MAGMQQTWWKKTLIRHENKRKKNIQKWTKNGQFHKNIAVKNHILKSQHNTEDNIIKTRKRTFFKHFRNSHQASDSLFQTDCLEFIRVSIKQFPIDITSRSTVFLAD